MLILNVISFLLLISHKMAFSYFREPVLDQVLEPVLNPVLKPVLEPVLEPAQEPFTVHVLLLFRKYVNFEGNYLIFTPNVT